MAEHPVEAQVEEAPVLAGAVAVRELVGGVGRVAPPEVRGQEGVLAAERPGVDDQPGGVGVRDQAGGRASSPPWTSRPGRWPTSATRDGLVPRGGRNGRN